MGAFSIRTKTFRLGLADYRALWLVEAGRAFLYPLLGLVFLAPALTAYLRHTDVRTYLWAQSALLGLFVPFVIGLAVLDRVIHWRKHRRNPVMTGERIMLFDDGAVRLIGDGFDTRWTWLHFSRARLGRNHLFIYSSSHRVCILPRSAFAAPHDMERLAEAAGGAIRVARQAAAPLPSLPEAPDSREIWRSLPVAGRDVCFTRDYVRSTGPTLDSRSGWDHVRKVGRRRSRIIFDLLSGQFIVPASAFATPAQATAFYAQAVAFWRAAQARQKAQG